MESLFCDFNVLGVSLSEVYRKKKDYSWMEGGRVNLWYFCILNKILVMVMVLVTKKVVILIETNEGEVCCGGMSCGEREKVK